VEDQLDEHRGLQNLSKKSAQTWRLREKAWKAGTSGGKPLSAGFLSGADQHLQF